MIFDEYIDYIKNSEEKYQWPLEKLNERLIERKKIHKEYPYIITVASDYYWLDDVEPGKHSHKGIWTTFWIIKTGYDYGYQDFCFKHEVDWLKFLFLNFSFDNIETHIKKENGDEV